MLALEVEPSLSFNIPLHFLAMWQIAAQGQSDTVVSDMEVCVKQRYGTEFLHAEIIAHTDIHWYLLNIYGDQSVDVSAVRWWVVRFSSGDSDSRSSLLVQIFTSMARRFLFIAGENAQLMVVTVLKNSVL